MTEHADLEALSAYVDGEAPEWADHVAVCAMCRASADRLRGVAAVVGGPVAPPPAASRETAIAAALDSVDRGPADRVERRRLPERDHFARRRWDQRWALPAVAAVIVGALGFSALLAANTRSSKETTVAGPAFETAPPAGDLSAKADSSAGATVAPEDLGDVPDAATLLARARPAVAESGRSAVSANPQAAPPTTSLTARTPAIVGTRPCEEQVRARQPGLGEVVYFATARRGPVPAFVLGFASGPNQSPVTLLLLAQDGCAELLRASAP